MDQTKIRKAAASIELATMEILGELEKTPVDQSANMARAEPVDALEPDHLVIGRGAARPGQVVTVEVLAGSSKPIEGFGAYVGCDPRLVLERWSVTPDIRGLTGIENPQAAVRQKRGQGIQGYLSLHFAFFGLIRISRDATDEEAEAEKDRLRPTRISAQLPPMTPLFALTFRVPDDARIGEEFKLDNTPLKYGSYYRDPVSGRRLTQRLDAAFGVTKELGPQIKPQCVSGWIEVVAP